MAPTSLSSLKGTHSNVHSSCRVCHAILPLQKLVVSLRGLDAHSSRQLRSSPLCVTALPARTVIGSQRSSQRKQHLQPLQAQRGGKSDDTHIDSEGSMAEAAEAAESSPIRTIMEAVTAMAAALGYLPKNESPKGEGGSMTEGAKGGSSVEGAKGGSSVEGAKGGSRVESANGRSRAEDAKGSGERKERSNGNAHHARRNSAHLPHEEALPEPKIHQRVENQETGLEDQLETIDGWSMSEELQKMEEIVHRLKTWERLGDPKVWMAQIKEDDKSPAPGLLGSAHAGEGNGTEAGRVLDPMLSEIVNKQSVESVLNLIGTIAEKEEALKKLKAKMAEAEELGRALKESEIKLYHNTLTLYHEFSFVTDAGDKEEEKEEEEGKGESVDYSRRHDLLAQKVQRKLNKLKAHMAEGGQGSRATLAGNAGGKYAEFLQASDAWYVSSAENVLEGQKRFMELLRKARHALIAYEMVVVFAALRVFSKNGTDEEKGLQREMKLREMEKEIEEKPRRFIHRVLKILKSATASATELPNESSQLDPHDLSLDSVGRAIRLKAIGIKYRELEAAVEKFDEACKSFLSDGGVEFKVYYENLLNKAGELVEEKDLDPYMRLELLNIIVILAERLYIIKTRKAEGTEEEEKEVTDSTAEGVEALMNEANKVIKVIGEFERALYLVLSMNGCSDLMGNYRGTQSQLPLLRTSQQPNAEQETKHNGQHDIAAGNTLRSALWSKGEGSDLWSRGEDSDLWNGEEGSDLWSTGGGRKASSTNKSSKDDLSGIAGMQDVEQKAMEFLLLFQKVNESSQRIRTFIDEVDEAMAAYGEWFQGVSMGTMGMIMMEQKLLHGEVQHDEGFKKMMRSILEGPVEVFAKLKETFAKVQVTLGSFVSSPLITDDDVTHAMTKISGKAD